MARSSGFATVIKRARFKPVGFSPTAMTGFGRAMISSIQARWDRAQDIYDQSAPPLSAKYQAWKAKKYGSEVRDLRATGRTRRGMNVLEAGQNYCIIGFSDAVAGERVRLNNRIARQWGISPVNEREFTKAVLSSAERPVVAVQEKG